MMEEDSRRQQRRFFMLTFGALVLMVILMILGTLYFSDQIGQPEHHAREVHHDDVDYVFWTDVMRFRADETIPLHFQVRNRSTVHVDMTFPPGEQFTVDILDGKGTRVAHLPPAPQNPQTTTYALDPWSQATFDLQWTPGVAGLPRLGVGTYRFLGMLKGIPQTAISLPIEITER
jgi:hypothetical protein